MKTLQQIQSDYLSIDFFLSMSCNKNCYYCTSYTLEMRNLTVDMDFLKQTLGYLKNYKVRVNLLGGEPGLIKNLDEVISEIKKNPNHVCSVLSNSFVRKRYPHILEDKDILYVEHNILDWYEHEVTKLGNFDYIPENDLNNYNVVVRTPNFFKYKDKYPECNEEVRPQEYYVEGFNGRSPEFTDIVQHQK